MEKIVLLSSLVVLIQLSDAYLRWLSFSREMSRKETITLWKRFAGYSIISWIMYCVLLVVNGIGAAEYKGMLMLGWIPYLVIFISEVGGRILRHIFIFNMSALWSFLQHNWCSIITVICFADRTDEEIILIHAMSYVILFVIMLPIERYFFTRLLLPQTFFDIRPQGLYIAFLPLVILLAHVIRLADDVLVHSWEERLSRIYLPFVFLFFYKYVSETARIFYRQLRMEKLEWQLGEKITELKDYNRFMQELQKNAVAIRQDLRKSYRLIYKFLEEGHIEKAREYLSTQKILIESKEERQFEKSAEKR